MRATRWNLSRLGLVATTAGAARQTVTLDSFFNNEVKQDATGRTVRWHYKWEEMAKWWLLLLGKRIPEPGRGTQTDRGNRRELRTNEHLYHRRPRH